MSFDGLPPRIGGTVPFPAFRIRAVGVRRLARDAGCRGIRIFNHQGGPRGGDELRVPNWWMGMFERKVGSSNLTINTMLSLDPLTVGKKGYRELFQVGEAFEGKPLIDYQHPHDLFMQLAVVWRMPIGSKHGLHTGRRSLGGARARSGRLHAPRLGNGESDVAARPPHARLDAHRVRSGDGGGRPRAMDDRRLGLQRPRA